MRQHNAEGVSESRKGLTSFPTVPIESIPARKASDAASALRPVVLVVDDKPSIADSLTEILDRNGYAAIAVYDAESALETALVVPPDVAVIDAGLPASNGVELAASLRGKLPGCKIVLISGVTEDSELLAKIKIARLEPQGDAKKTGGQLVEIFEG